MSTLTLSKEDYDEVVALIIQGEIYLAQGAIAKVNEVREVDGIIPRAMFKAIDHLDCNPKWREYASYPTLFTISEYNEWCKLPNGKPIC